MDISSFAYIDPGTGSIILQAVLGAVLGIGIVVKTYWAKIVRVFKSGKNSDSNESQESE